MPKDLFYDSVETFGLIEETNIKRYEAQIIRVKGKKKFRIIRAARKEKWPKEMWVIKASSPLLGKTVFAFLIDLIMKRGKEILDILDD